MLVTVAGGIVGLKSHPRVGEVCEKHCVHRWYIFRSFTLGAILQMTVNCRVSEWLMISEITEQSLIA